MVGFRIYKPKLFLFDLGQSLKLYVLAKVGITTIHAEMCPSKNGDHNSQSVLTIDRWHNPCKGSFALENMLEMFS